MGAPGHQIVRVSVDPLNLIRVDVERENDYGGHSATDTKHGER